MGTVHARRLANARTKPKPKRRPQETGRSASARTKPKLQRRPEDNGTEGLDMLLPSVREEKKRWDLDKEGLFAAD